MNSPAQMTTCPNGWVKGNFDGFPGERIYPSWQGALEGKRLVCRDVRMLNGAYFIHNPWMNVVLDSFDTIQQVEAHILQSGTVPQPGANVWD